MPNRRLWLVSLLFVAWLIWAETSFQFYDHALGRDLQLSASRVSLIAGSFLVPYGLLQIPVGRLLDQGQIDRWIWIAALMASGFSLTFAFSTDLVGLMLSRMGTGVACAVAFPASALLARRALPANRFALAMGLTDSLLGWGAVFAALIPLVFPWTDWRQLVVFQALFLAVMVVLPVMALGRGLPSPELPQNHGGLASSVHWNRAGIGKVIKACLLYAWGGGFVFGLAQYGLISGLRVWGAERTQWMSLSMSFGIGVGMVVAGWLGSRSSRRGLVLLTGTGINVLALIALLQLPNQAGGLLGLAALGLGLGLGCSVLAFPIAEDAAPPGQTAFTVAIVNTTGTVTGGVMSIVSGLILEASGPGDLSPVLAVYGLFGVAVAAWIQLSSAPVQSEA
ncbi:MAG: MFS transporter [Synechococcus sp. SP2 MAG]|nr:MFS transporter [Synechococcus sp. SP2 MAG]